MDIKLQIEKLLSQILSEMGVTDASVTVSPSNDSSHGEYSTNVALNLSKKLGKSPVEAAEMIVNKVSVIPAKAGIQEDKNWIPDQVGDDKEIASSQASRNDGFIEKIEVVKPGFINFFLAKEAMGKTALEILEGEKYKSGDKKKIMVEFTDPNPFKEFHIGHLYSNIVGESICRLLESAGNEVKRVCYQGDVGLHVAKSIWGLNLKLKTENLKMEELEKKSLPDKAKFLGESYALGAKEYEENPQVKEEIISINKHVYARDDAEVNSLYQKGREWSLAYFELIYKRLGTHFDHYYFESNAGPKGIAFVQEHMDIFRQSEGAIIFPGEEYGLHTRVFINSQGLPTYEAKEMALAPTKYADYPYDQSIIITGNEVNEYFRTVLKALSLINPELADKTKHLSHGMVKLSSGKMSSRSGNVITGEWLLNEAVKRSEEKVKESERDEEVSPELSETVGIAAVKYALLKGSIGKDVTFDFDESISFEGNSGPYLQYTHVRCCSILRKSQITNHKSQINNIGQGVNFETYTFSQEESDLLRTIYYFNEIVSRAAETYSPHLICAYLFDLAQEFNLFYQKQPILKAEQEEQRNMRLLLVQATAKVLKDGLHLLGIEAPERM